MYLSFSWLFGSFNEKASRVKTKKKDSNADAAEFRQISDCSAPSTVLDPLPARKYDHGKHRILYDK